MPDVAQFTTVQFQFSLMTDPPGGPYTSSVNITIGTSLTVVLSQVTVGPAANVNVSLGDGSAVQQFYLVSSSVNITYNYTTAGTFNISAKVASFVGGLSATPIINPMTVFVKQPPIYRGM
jgi:hypothetical protein